MATTDDVQALVGQLRELAVWAAEAPQYSSASPAFCLQVADAIERLLAELRTSREDAELNAARIDVYREHMAEMVERRDAQVREAFGDGYRDGYGDATVGNPAMPSERRETYLASRQSAAGAHTEERDE